MTNGKNLISSPTLSFVGNTNTGVASYSYNLHSPQKRWLLKVMSIFWLAFFLRSFIHFYNQHKYCRFRNSKTTNCNAYWYRLSPIPFCTAKTQYQKFETNIPKKGIVRPPSQSPHSCVSQRFIYSHDWSAYSATGKYVDQSWKYINRSQTHECGNWDWGRAVSFLGIYKWDFRCSVGAVFLISVSKSRQGGSTHTAVPGQTITISDQTIGKTSYITVFWKCSIILYFRVIFFVLVAYNGA